MALVAETFGQRVRRLREAKGWTQIHFAVNVLGANPQTVSRWERGLSLRRPDRRLVERAARALGTTVPYLLRGEEEPGEAAAPEERRQDGLQPLREAIATVQGISDQAVEELVRQVVLYVDRRWPRLGGGAPRP